LDEADRGNKYGLSQGDFYQLYAYGKIYLKGQASSELVLIYPATDSFAKSLPVFDYGDGMKLWVLPFDLTDQVLIDSEQTTLPIRVHEVQSCGGYSRVVL
jgi:5-methylcytosine-specific restriction enzyme subunit McrC